MPGPLNLLATDTTPEVAYRGTKKSFEFGFFADDDQTIPIVPADASTYPRVQLVDPDGMVYTTTGPPAVRPSSRAGFWVYEFDIPSDATITAAGEAWEFLSEIVNASGRREAFRSTFSVKDPTVVKATNTERFYASVKGRPVRIMYRSATELYDVNVSVLRSGSEDDYLLERAVLGNSAYDIQHRTSDGLHIYYVDITATKVSGFTEQALETGVWQVHWGVTESGSEPEELVYQIIEVYNNKVLEHARHVRGIVDKLQKRSSSAQAWKEADIMEGLAMGLQFVNSVFPSTSYTFESLPTVLMPYLQLGAAYWLYLAQLGLSVDLQFNFSGQTTVLDQDQTGGIGDLLERYRSALWDQLKEVKTDVLRHQRPVGVVATRPSRARYMNRTVFRVSSANSLSTIQFLNGLGII